MSIKGGSGGLLMATKGEWKLVRQTQPSAGTALIAIKSYQASMVKGQLEERQIPDNSE